jgi:hypothetical protein
MKDRDFLIWIHARLEHVHGESHLVDYMHKLRAIIAATPPDQVSPNTGQGKNSLPALIESLGTNQNQHLENMSEKSTSKSNNACCPIPGVSMGRWRRSSQYTAAVGMLRRLARVASYTDAQLKGFLEGTTLVPTGETGIKAYLEDLRRSRKA